MAYWGCAIWKGHSFGNVPFWQVFIYILALCLMYCFWKCFMCLQFTTWMVNLLIFYSYFGCFAENETFSQVINDQFHMKSICSEERSRFIFMMQLRLLEATNECNATCKFTSKNNECAEWNYISKTYTWNFFYVLFRKTFSTNPLFLRVIVADFLVENLGLLFFARSAVRIYINFSMIRKECNVFPLKYFKNRKIMSFSIHCLLTIVIRKS